MYKMIRDTNKIEKTPIYTKKRLKNSKLKLLIKLIRPHIT
jgi:hypothetical protein